MSDLVPSTSPKTTAMVPDESTSNEMAVAAQTQMARSEIESALIVAQRIPRNEDQARQDIERACNRPRFAELARYTFRRGGQVVQGPSVNMARELARVWGNIRSGADVIYDDDKTRTIRAWAWDLQTNTQERQDVTFKKAIQRKGRDGKTTWISPDERDLRELTNSQGAKAVRNCILHLIPRDIVDDAMQVCIEAVARDVAKDPEDARKRMVRAFDKIGVSVTDLETYLGHPLRQITEEEIVTLKGVWQSINEGNSHWSEYMPKPEPASVQVEQKPKPKSSAAQPAATSAKTPASTLDDWRKSLAKAKTLEEVDALEQDGVADPVLTREQAEIFIADCAKRRSEVE